MVTVETTLMADWIRREVLKSIIDATEPGRLETATEEFAASASKDFIMFQYKKFDIESCLLHLSSVALSKFYFEAISILFFQGSVVIL
jgi:hypothetical protein